MVIENLLLVIANYLTCALAAGCKAIISRDDDLLKKPFGIEIITPQELLRRLAK